MTSETTGKLVPISEEKEISASAKLESEERECSEQTLASEQTLSSDQPPVSDLVPQSYQPSPPENLALPTGQPEDSWERPPLLVLKDRELDHQCLQLKLATLKEKICQMRSSGELVPDEEGIQLQEKRELYTLPAKSFP